MKYDVKYTVSIPGEDIAISATLEGCDRDKIMASDNEMVKQLITTLEESIAEAEDE